MTSTAATLALVFLDPVAGIVAGSIALPALALLYFLKLRRRPVRISSTMLWDRAVEDLQVNTPFRWLRLSLLLFIQALALGLLAAALGRPALLDPAAPPTGRVIFLIDASASMNARDGDDSGATRLDEAKRQALEMINRLRTAETEAMVISFAAAPRIEAPFSRSRAILRDGVATIDPTDQPDDLDEALRIIRAFVASAGEEDESVATTVVLFSDGALDRPAPDRREAVPGADVRFVRIGPTADAARDNIGLAALSARRDESDPGVVRLFARLLSTSADPVRTALTIRVNGDIAQSVPVEFSGASDGPAEAPLTTTFPAPPDERALIVAGVAREDALATDNSAAVVVEPASSLRVWLVANAAPNQDLREALSLLAPGEGALRVMTLAEFERTLPTAAAPPDVVVFDRARPGALPAIPTISFGATLPIPGLGVADRADASPTRILLWRRTDPIMRDVILDTIIVARPLELTLPEEQVGVVAATLAQGEQGPLIARLEQGSLQRIVVGFDLDASNWPLHLSFPIFMTNALEQLSARAGGSGGRAYSTAEPITVRAAPGASEVRVRGPVDRTVSVRAEDASAPIGVLPVAGVYTLENAAERDSALPVNLFSDHESRIASADAIDVSGQSASGVGAAGAAPREVWLWCVLAALALFTLEWFLFAWQMRV